MKLNKSIIYNYLSLVFFIVFGFVITYPYISVTIKFIGVSVAIIYWVWQIISLIKSVVDLVFWMDKEYMEGFKILGEGFEILSKCMHIHPEMGKESQASIIEVLNPDKKISNYQKIIKDFEKIKDEFKEGKSDIKIIKSNFQFLLWFIPTSLAIIAIIVAIVAIRK